MPLVRSVDPIADGFRIVTTNGGTFDLTSADVPKNVYNQGAAAVETWVNDWLANNVGRLGMFAAVHVNSLGPPLDAQVLVSNNPITGEWWVRPVTT